MSDVEWSKSRTYVVFGLIFGLPCIWLLFSSTGPGHRVEATINDIMPGWFIVANFFFAPSLTALAAGALRIRLPLRVALAALTACSILILEISFRRFPLESSLVLAIFLLEAYWIIPKWSGRCRRTPPAGTEL